ncbi:unnamed protein product [Orchesella dallaii]|uniref:AB hydrolase-1 domain-containing protein n=1 Tax=Orchesella dallaii TaxID=48710 RepID=A0ABP1S7R3_9HEXA
MGIFDLPTIVDQIRAETEHQKIFVIGHSQGSTLFLVGASEVPELNDKIHAAYLMAPAAFLGGAYEPFLTSVLPLLITPFENFLFTIFAGRIQRKNTRLMALLSSFQLHDICQPRILRCGLCGTVFGTNTFNPTQMNYTNIPRMVSKLFNVENFRSSIHFGQQIRSCGFRYYDHGPAGNLKRYGTEVPPNYKLERVTAPLHLLWAEQDSIVTPTDVQKLAESLSPQTLKSVTRINDDTFDHTDFSVARDANILVYEPLIAKMTKAWEEIVGGSSTR